MIQFTCDYTRTAVPEVLEALAKAKNQYTGYGEDEITAEAARMIRHLTGDENVAVHFLLGGTQTNSTVIAAALRTHQSVVAATTGHINVHETGAIEASGHKVTVIQTEDGKLSAEAVDECLTTHEKDPNVEHIVQPAMVYISNPTELGTLYSLKELTALAEVCRKHEVLLYMDGARLGYGLAADENDLTLKEITKLTDAYYLGGTKCGTLFGEALVIKNPMLKKDFRYIMKQRGALLAKGFLLGLQFRTMFDGESLEDTLYYKYARHAICEAQKIRATLKACNVPLLLDSPTNQLFPQFTEKTLSRLKRDFVFDIWSPTLVRIATDWSTHPEETEKLISTIRGEFCNSPF
ncbi:MAG: aminotransferase class I/II-fold pyridoxal phosphate-dependent enzyme [Paludibacteraceae bacterium]|nr:aminotransferase class I/II-fold pyridoxal phosphate-dependent enzyme [Paludibacteraceae bacterium]